MQLNRFTDYALRVMMHLAAANGRLMSTREIADLHEAKYNHLAKVTQWLANEGYIETIRGRSGGIALAKQPDQICIGTLVRKLESQTALVECMREDRGNCRLSVACGLAVVLKDAEESFFRTLDQVTLADVLKRQSGMFDLLISMNAK
ncbi:MULTISPECIES: Rrf2 family transcriptional regulator [unclassified Thalassospira]|uniref:RrF2 family transcriptional regulator n=1 Tax=unclassified Thalassospira TaxID=2648997 RepID=UPI000EE5C783|nr:MULTISPECIES: Rrf2 family transcriptional regulator [unclassified Thalassospira]MBO6808996.1 Rrf2 family transcriptional regulator [Thalassospira sp.]MBO6841978.1 Rrf2 family transcriptional regulator [Thalassospira sp.]MBR9902161.1 Rrf2 family transcriptional regulator [Rhodospirillales bacterium]HAI29168.1 Rrf2 family transcriptional regulator [Thalassospira sp.]|tara:strand:- start:4613 stop:5056 length:444 start_codon:yes stop_codon:yes gene_type:complete